MPVKAPIASEGSFAREEGIQHEADKLNHMATERVVYTMSPAVTFGMIEGQFKPSAQENVGRSCSRQNNCNHAVYTTLSALYAGA